MTRRPTKGAYLVDTSVAVPLVVAAHPEHTWVTEAVGLRSLGLAGHAAFETFAVLTRLPGRDRRSPAALGVQLSRSFPVTAFLSGERAQELLQQLSEHGLAGGSVFDALVGAACVEHRMTLISRDRRARATYAALGVEVEFIG